MKHKFTRCVECAKSVSSWKVCPSCTENANAIRERDDEIKTLKKEETRLCWMLAHIKHVFDIEGMTR